MPETGIDLETADRIVTLVKGGADPQDAAHSLGVAPGAFDMAVQDEAFRERLTQAEATARALIDAGKRKARPGEWERRSHHNSKLNRDPGTLQGDGPPRVSVPGAPIKCIAISSQHHRPCKNWAMLYGNVCRKHGGAAPQVARARARRRAIHELMERVDAPTDPLDVLLNAVAMSSALAESYRIEVGDLESSEMVGDDYDLALRRLGESLDRAARTAKMALDAGVDERMVKMSERVADTFTQVIRAIFDDPTLALTADQRALAPQIAARHLRAIEAG